MPDIRPGATRGRKPARDSLCTECGHSYGVHWDGICGSSSCAEWMSHPDSRCPSAPLRYPREPKESL